MAQEFFKKVEIPKEKEKEDDSLRELFNLDEDTEIKNIKQLVNQMNRLSLERKHKLTDYKERIAMMIIKINGNREYTGIINEVEASLKEPLMEDLPITHKVKKLVNLFKEAISAMQNRYEYIMRVESEKGALYEKLLEFYNEKHNEIEKLYTQVSETQTRMKEVEKEKIEQRVSPEMEDNFMKEIGNKLCVGYMIAFKRNPNDPNMPFQKWKEKFLREAGMFFFTLDRKTKEQYSQDLFFKGTRNPNGSLKDKDWLGNPVPFEMKDEMDLLGNRMGVKQ